MSHRKCSVESVFGGTGMPAAGMQGGSGCPEGCLLPLQVFRHTLLKKGKAINESTSVEADYAAG